MSSIGWEYFGIKFSIVMTMLAGAFMILSTWFVTRKDDHFSHVDTAAGDEGED